VIPESVISFFRRWWPAPAPKPQPVPSPSPDNIDLALLAAHNQQRANCGLPALSLHPALCASAEGHSQEMANRGVLDHNSADGTNPFQRMQQAGFVGSDMGENIAEGQPTVASVMAAWMGDAPHRQNILGPYKYVGFGVAYRGNTPFWTVDFGG
jgi:uncharacterized protein YkwD